MLRPSHFLKIEGSENLKVLMNLYTLLEHPPQAVQLAQRAIELGFNYDQNKEISTPVAFSILYSGLSPIKSSVPAILGLYYLPFDRYIEVMEQTAKYIEHK